MIIILFLTVLVTKKNIKSEWDPTAIHPNWEPVHTVQIVRNTQMYPTTPLRDQAIESVKTSSGNSVAGLDFGSPPLLEA